MGTYEDMHAHIAIHMAQREAAAAAVDLGLCLAWIRRNEDRDTAYWPCVPLSKLLVSLLLTPIVVPNTIPYKTPFKEFRL